MYIGSGVLLIVIGAILKFALAKDQVEGIDLGMIGIILMIAGAALVLISLLMASRRRVASTDRVVRNTDGQVVGSEQVEHRDTY